MATRKPTSEERDEDGQPDCPEVIREALRGQHGAQHIDRARRYCELRGIEVTPAMLGHR